MIIPGAIETATAGLEVASAISGLAREDRSQRLRLRPIISALRDIYFTPRGTVRVLTRIANGERPDPDDVEDVLTDFNGAEWLVQRRVRELDFDRLAQFDGLSLRQRRTLDQIAYGKIQLRRDIQDALNECLTFEDRLPYDDASVLLKRVDALNAMVESLEEEFL